MERYSHKYIFYFYPKFDMLTGTWSKGFFRFYGRVKFGKETAKATGREYDYDKLF